MQVLDTLAYAERELLDAHPEFAHARVLVHLSSDVQVGASAGGRHPLPPPAFGRLHSFSQIPSGLQHFK